MNYFDEIWAAVPADRHAHPVLTRWASERLLGVKGKLLDFGCGDGKLTATLSEAGAEVVGADPSQVALERAQVNAPAARFVAIDDGGRLPLPDSEFAAAAAINVLEHVLDTQTALSELRRVLAPGGALSVSVPRNGWLQTVLGGPGGFTRSHDPLGSVLRFYTSRSLRELLEQFGFEQVSIERSRHLLLAGATRG